jgi:hypothetical protein
VEVVAVADVAVVSVNVVVASRDGEVVVAAGTVVVGLSAEGTHALRLRTTMGRNSQLAPVRRIGLSIDYASNVHVGRNYPIASVWVTGDMSLDIRLTGWLTRNLEGSQN